jgi:enoyl-CoA hydratase/carnithine racemase
MSYLEIEHVDGVATVRMSRGKVHALHGEMVAELRSAFRDLAQRDDTSGAVLTGTGAFFSFGLDVPGLYDLTPAAFADFLRDFTALYTELFGFPKPLVAAVNGHAAAGGCMLALAADLRLMADGTGKIGLNEASFGSSLFAGSVEMLRFAVGDRAAVRVARTGALFDVRAAAELGLVDEIVPGGQLVAEARSRALAMSHGHLAAFRSIKSLLRDRVIETMRAAEPASIDEFVEIWYSDSTRKELQRIQIRR